MLNTISKSSSDTPVIVISGAGELNDAIQALRFGAGDYLTKPIADLQVLEHAVNKALERKQLIMENRLYAQRIEQSLKILEEDQIAGRRVQMSLLPPETLIVKDFIFKYKIFPSLGLSGDFVEYFAITEDIYGVYLADVSGHGASSAFITVLLKSLVAQFQAYYRINKNDTIMSPPQMMQVLSNEIYAAKLSKYLTIIYGVMNLATNEFTYGVGGHYPNPILVKADSSAHYLPGSGFPVGIIARVDYQAQKTILNRGEYLVMFSDGIMEIMSPEKNLDLKDQALLDIVVKSKGDIPTMLAACGFDPETKVQQPDDITVLVIGHN